MFAALELLPRPTDLFGRLVQRMRPALPELRQVSVPGGAPFLLVRTVPRADGIPWDAVRQTAGRCAGRMLLPAGETPPEGSGIAAFVPKTLPLRLCFATAARLLSESAVPAARLSVGILDPAAVLPDLVERVVMCASQITVCTDRPAAYADTARRFLHTYGAALHLRTSPGALRGCAVLIVPAAKDGVSSAGSAAKVLFCPEADGGAPRVPCVIGGAGVDAPQSLTALCPPGIDLFGFCCAVYELCGVRGMETGRFGTLYRNGVEVSEYRAATALRAALSG